MDRKQGIDFRSLRDRLTDFPDSRIDFFNLSQRDLDDLLEMAVGAA